MQWMGTLGLRSDQSGLRRSLHIKTMVRNPFVILLLIALALTIYKFIQVVLSKSFGWDSAAFMENGAVFAGFSQYYQAYDPTRPPFLPVLLSLMYRLTGVVAVDGYAISAVLYFLSMVGAYLLARKMMNSWIAIMPAVSFGVAPTVLQWSGMVYSDVEGTAIASLALASVVYSIDPEKENFGIGSGKRGILLVFALPLFILAALTRYSMGAVIFAGLVYVAATKSWRPLIRAPFFYVGVFLGIVVLFALGEYWIGFPLSHGYSALSIFPVPQQANPFESSLGHAFFAFNFTAELGAGLYGYLVATAFIISAGFAVFRLAFDFFKRRRRKDEAKIDFEDAMAETEGYYPKKEHSKTDVTQKSGQQTSFLNRNPLLFGLLTWFAITFTYYSLFWPYSDLRYSIEFAMPVMIVAYWGVNRTVFQLYHFAIGKRTAIGRPTSTEYRSRHPVIVAFCLTSIIIITALFVAFESQSAIVAYQSTPVVDVTLSEGIRQAASWIRTNVPLDAHIQGDWYTFLWWYLPGYSITAAPASYQLQTSANYSAWANSIAENDVSYIVYSNPGAISVPPQFQLVYMSPVGGVAVYRVNQ